ncbi:hypothetical protein [Rhodococcus artemisiae]|uniref:Uncharacterized protein n=1 Tax=Rhodococcus artemisiae TaxID=714159 RepID=A0ABU7LBF2_9NOCA|nr:hypothetical protein [Rhodococcus artemisiae]MEE2058868.1 hypothetical protein [Rhodococcus artemisiae]
MGKVEALRAELDGQRPADVGRRSVRRTPRHSRTATNILAADRS